MKERVVIQTQDQVVLVGSFDPAQNAKRVVLLLHMMPMDRESWANFQSVLTASGMASLAIDLRGHGESTVQDGRTIHYQAFSDEEHQASREDVSASINWLMHRGFPLNRVGIVGASFGANLALQAMIDHPEIPALALLSPGENYHGVETFDYAPRLLASQSLWAAGSAGDDQESFDAAKKIVERAPCAGKEFKSYTAAGHGTLLFQNDPKLMSYLAEWLNVHIKES
ncbi:MAG TPA: alpha/beta fold hydrolase [Patescibacteria group bacterium]|nr:alpha/beta fold hydrolase [Patescibacteria group bacterium]